MTRIPLECLVWFIPLAHCLLAMVSQLSWLESPLNNWCAMDLHFSLALSQGTHHIEVAADNPIYSMLSRSQPMYLPC